MNEKEALEAAKSNMKASFDYFLNNLGIELADLAKSESIVEFMSRKQDMMQLLLSAILPSPKSCPFCRMYYGDSCDSCQYGNTHGCCHTQGSCYHDLMCRINNLSELIKNYWEVEKYESKNIIVDRNAA